MLRRISAVVKINFDSFFSEARFRRVARALASLRPSTGRGIEAKERHMRHLTICAIASCAFPVLAAADYGLEQVDQRHLNSMVENGDLDEAFIEAFEAGDELTEFSFDADRGVGVNVGEGRRFTRFPRADLTGPGEWATHFPMREGGANATSCIACHNAPFANGAGDVALNAVVDPAHTGDPSKYLERNTLPLFALGIPQRLAEEISATLYQQRDAARAKACETGSAIAQLEAKGVSYGQLSITRTAEEPCAVQIDASGLDGIDEDLVVRAFGWKGNHSTIRAFTRGAAHNELGLQAVEIVGNADGDYDGVIDELTVGDMTALTVYMAGLERPVTAIELEELGLIELSEADKTDILTGEELFVSTGCASCHTPTMPIADPHFREPSNTPGFYDVTFPDGSDPGSHGLSFASAIEFNLAGDQPNNRIDLEDGSTHLLGGLEIDEDGTAVAHWYTDFKRHDMGPDLADPDDPLGLGASTFLTRSLAGVGITGPWLHDGRATTLHEAITMHGGAATDSRNSYVSLPERERAQIQAFLENLTMYQSEEEHG